MGVPKLPGGQKVFKRYGPQTDMIFKRYGPQTDMFLFQWMELPSVLRGGRALHIKLTMAPGVFSVFVADAKRQKL